MTVRPHLVVTGHDADGRSVCSADGPAEPLVLEAFPGSEFYPVWGTADGVPELDGAPPVVRPFFPGTGGTRAVFVRYPPSEPASSQPVGAAAAAEVERLLPGMTAHFDPERPGVHVTDSIDYGVCLEGELCLELDDGSEIRLRPGTCVVQRGTRHAWRNRSDQPALMLFVMVGAARPDPPTR